MASFYDDLRALLNRRARENASDTPDFILAEYLLQCLDAFDGAIYLGRREVGQILDALDAMTRERDVVLDMHRISGNVGHRQWWAESFAWFWREIAIEADTQEMIRQHHVLMDATLQANTLARRLAKALDEVTTGWKELGSALHQARLLLTEPAVQALLRERKEG